MPDREHRAFGQFDELGVGDDGGDFQNGVGIRVETGHLEIEPDQSVFGSVFHDPARVQ